MQDEHIILWKRGIKQNAKGQAYPPADYFTILNCIIVCLAISSHQAIIWLCKYAAALGTLVVWNAMFITMAMDTGIQAWPIPPPTGLFDATPFLV